MPSVFSLKALGLNNMLNQLEAPEGSLVVAQNVNINRDNVLEPRRGFKVYGDAFGLPTDRTKQLFSYKLRILRHFSNVLQYDDGSGHFTSFSGSVTEAQSGLRIKSIEANGNLYFTTSDGIKKISAKTAADFSSISGVVTNAGAIKAIDLVGKANYQYGDQTDFLPQDSAVAYRVVWGYKDKNTNLILGTPSQRIEVYNPLLTLLIQDYMHLLGGIDNIGRSGSLINDQNYVDILKLGINASTSDLWNNLLALTTKLDKNLLYTSAYNNLGNWDASTNTPHIQNNTHSAQDTYIVTTPGTQDLGGGSITYNLNDVLTYDGQKWAVNTTYTYLGTFDASEQFIGYWNATINAPVLADGTGIINTYYKVNGAGTQNLGSGNQTFAIGDYVKYNGSTWLKSTTPRVSLKNGIGIENQLYRVAVAGSVDFGAGPINLNVNDLLYYSANNTWTLLQNTLNYLSDWNASSNSPFLYNSITTNGSYYTVSVAGTQDLGAGPIVFSIGDRVLFDNNAWTITNYTNKGTWNAATNTPSLVNGVGTQGDYYTVGTEGVQDLGDGALTYFLNDRVMYVDGKWVINTFNISTGGLLVISAATIANGACTITFSSGNPSLYLSPASKILLSGFTVGVSDTTINTVQTVSAVTSTTLSFNTTLTGTVTFSASASITSNAFRSITEPSAPSIPATDAELVDLQTYIRNIINQLISEPDAIIGPNAKGQYINTLDVTTSSTVTLTITIPENITSDFFFQIYRTSVFRAVNTQVLFNDVFPNDEMQLVYEAFPTTAELAAKQITVIDVVPDNFRGANLYTNPTTGEGILQANDVPPFAKDINVFKGSVFYANTFTRQQQLFSLLGVQSMITDYKNGIIPTITFSTATSSNTYTFILGQPEIFNLVCNDGSTLATSGSASYFDFNSGNNGTLYRFYYLLGTVSAPSANGRTLVPIVVSNTDTSSIIAQKTRDAINIYNGDFIAVVSTNTVIITAVTSGYTVAPTAGTTGFTVTITQSGTGENAALKQVLLSSNISPAVAVQETAQSLIRVVNQDSGENVYIYYTSGAQEVPGQMIIEGRTLSTAQFSIVSNNESTGQSFNPDISPILQISSITVGGPTVNTVVTTTPHGLTNLDYVYISGSNSTPSIDGYRQITYVNSTTFRVNATITIAGSKGGVIPSIDSLLSTNQQSPNRVYYSKLQQPEAVPTFNYFDVGARDKAILRIYPLRDSLFVFKEDGLYRISGEAIPFNLGLFDASCVLVAPDSVSSLSNIIYGWTRQGISSVTESGIRNISRPLDITLLPFSSSTYPGFTNATWALGYESDKSYTVFTVANPSDTMAQQGFKYNALTNTWTQINKALNCGVIHFPDDKMYVGPEDINQIEQERKSFSREDYADREYNLTILPNSNGLNLSVSSTRNIEENDVIVQEQTLSIYTYNMLLEKLDLDQGTSRNYYSTLKAKTGDNMRTKLLSLAAKLDSDGLQYTDYASSIRDISTTLSNIAIGSSNIITSTSHGLITGRQIQLDATNSIPSLDGQYIVTVIDANTFSIPAHISVTTAGTSGTINTLNQDFTDIQACYNHLVSKLNSDSKVIFNNYTPIINTTKQEVLVTGINLVTNIAQIAQDVQYIQGAFTVYKAIDCQVVYSPNTFGGDPITLKHMREAQIMFDSLAFTQGTISFATDLLPAFMDVPFMGDGPGLFGLDPFGAGFFGGASHGTPIRTYIPRNCQRCRYMVVKFAHKVAREKWSLYGISLTGETQLSSRAYK